MRGLGAAGPAGETWRPGRPTLLGVIGVILLTAGCGKTGPGESRQGIADEPAGLASMIHTADPLSERQLLSGFYGIESNSWRWAGAQFSVKLRPPANAARNGATLLLQCILPDAVLQKLQSMTLSCSINGTKLQPETYTQAGEQTYSRDVAPQLLTGNAVRVDFSFDKALPSSAGTPRELAAIVTIIGFEAKQ